MKTFKTPKGTELPILNLKGKDYLTVPYRVVWFREDHPDWSIETSFVIMEPDFTVAKAVISSQLGLVMATAHKSETKQGFADHMEKAETGAIGRALALCGYGTAFAHELEEGDRIVDSPIDKSVHVKTDNVSQIKTPFKVPAKFSKPDHPSSYAADYVIEFGKHKGTALKDFGDTDLQAYLNWLEGDSKKKGQSLRGPALTLKQKAELYFKAKDSSIDDKLDQSITQESFDSPPWPTDDDSLPF